MSWNKEERMESLSERVCDGEVDEEILPLIEIINSKPDYFTTSSCAGRIVVLQIPRIGDKENAEFLGKWHREVDVLEVKDTFSKIQDKTRVFLLTQSPIIHVRCRDLKSAISLRNTAVESGLKYSTLKSITLNSKNEPVKIMVEILSSENIHIPIAKDKNLFPDEEYLNFMVENANSTLKRAQNKLERFKEAIS
jgi:tRNA wybutosine-synthesizing protein 3